MGLQANTSRKVGKATHTARNAATSPLVTGLARLGYTVKGIVYVVIGILAVLLATNQSGGQATDQNGAIKAIYGSPLGEGFGRFLMVVMTIGLFSFALWSLIQALLDTEGKGRHVKGVVARVGYAFVAISYSLLGIVAYQIASTGSSSSQNSTSTTQNWTGLLLSQPAGILLVILLGIIVLAVSAYLGYKAYRAKFMRRLNLSSVSASTRKMVQRSGSFGYGALGVVFTIVGIFLIVAAVTHNPNDAKGLDSALVELQKQPFGPWLLGVLALGLLAYGVYSFAEARYRRVGGAV
jgi:hypothetical protein